MQQMSEDKHGLESSTLKNFEKDIVIKVQQKSLCFTKTDLVGQS